MPIVTINPDVLTAATQQMKSVQSELEQQKAQNSSRRSYVEQFLREHRRPPQQTSAGGGFFGQAGAAVESLEQRIERWAWEIWNEWQIHSVVDAYGQSAGMMDRLRSDTSTLIRQVHDAHRGELGDMIERLTIQLPNACAEVRNALHEIQQLLQVNRLADTCARPAALLAVLSRAADDLQASANGAARVEQVFAGLLQKQEVLIEDLAKQFGPPTPVPVGTPTPATPQLQPGPMGTAGGSSGLTPNEQRVGDSASRMAGYLKQETPGVGPFDQLNVAAVPGGDHRTISTQVYPLSQSATHPEFNWGDKNVQCFTFIYMAYAVAGIKLPYFATPSGRAAEYFGAFPGDPKNPTLWSKIPNGHGAPRIGDVICFTGGPNGDGHVAIVTYVGKDQTGHSIVQFAQANSTTQIGTARLDGGTVDDWGTLKCEGFIRYNG